MKTITPGTLLLTILMGLAISAPDAAAVGKGGAAAKAESNLKPAGKFHEALVPDTLDLAERARLGINGLTSSVDPDDYHNMYFLTRYTADPPYMLHMDIGDFLCCNPKWAESLPMMRVMCGSSQNIGTEKKIMGAIVNLIDPGDGLLYLPPDDLAKKPWYKRANYAIITEPITSPFGNARLMLAMMAWYQRDHNPAWLARIRNMADGLAKIALYKDNYAYYPEGKVGMEFAYLKTSGYKFQDEAQGEHEGAEGSVMLYQGNQIRALSRWYAVSGDKKALELAGKLARYVMRSTFWGNTSDSEWIIGREHAHFDGHHHGHGVALRGLLEYAHVANDQRIKEFVRDGYEYARGRGIGRIGCFGDHAWKSHTEGCSIADMVALAIKLSDYGVGDYWDDVDQYVRNQLVEQQLVRRDLLEKVSNAAEADKEAWKKFPEPVPWDPGLWGGILSRTHPQKPMTDRVIERTLGLFTFFGDPTVLPYPTQGGCCSGNCTNALYYAWESIVRCKGENAQVNLLLNRASPWLDVDSYLPYEGKVVIKNKTAKRLSVRIPRWADKNAVRSNINRRVASPIRVGSYLVFDKLRRKDVVTITFPMVEETVKYTMPFDKDYVCTFKGNTLVDISPRDTNPTGYPIYQRDHYKRNKAPMKKVTRYVSNTVIEW